MNFFFSVFHHGIEKLDLDSQDFEMNDFMIDRQFIDTHKKNNNQ